MKQGGALWFANNIENTMSICSEAKNLRKSTKYSKIKHKYVTYFVKVMFLN